MTAFDDAYARCTERYGEPILWQHGGDAEWPAFRHAEWPHLGPMDAAVDLDEGNGTVTMLVTAAGVDVSDCRLWTLAGNPPDDSAPAATLDGAMGEAVAWLQAHGVAG